jgi:hypothetical protein
MNGSRQFDRVEMKKIANSPCDPKALDPSALEFNQIDFGRGDTRQAAPLQVSIGRNWVGIRKQPVADARSLSVIYAHWHRGSVSCK